LTIAANAVSKPLGAELAEVNPGSTAFVPTGLVNGELVGTVTITYGVGRLAADLAQVYAGSVVPSAATGGTFTASNYAITYTAADLTVTADPTIALSGVFSAMTAEYGTASAAQSFTVSGGALTADVVVSAPTGFEVSDAAAGTYGASVTLTQTGGNVALTTLFLRMKGNNPFGPVATGNVSATSTGATTQTLVVPEGSVSKKTLTITGLAGVNKVYDGTNVATFTGTAALDGVVAGDGPDVTLDGAAATAVFGQVGLGVGVPVTVTGFLLDGTKAVNYVLTQPALTANIDRKELTLLNPVVTPRAFNGGVVATVTGTLDGVILPDEVAFPGVGAFVNAGPGDPIGVTVPGTLGGAGAGNYVLAPVTGLTGRINGGGSGATIAQWLFNGASSATIPGGTSAPSPTLGSGTAALVGGVAGSFSSGLSENASSDTTPLFPPNFGWGLATFPAASAANKTAGAQFNVSTAGIQGIQMRYDLRASNTGSRFAQVQYTLDGIAWTDFGGVQTLAGASWTNGNVVDFSSITGANNNPDFGVRIVSAFDPAGTSYVAATPTSTYATSGTWRFDRVEFSGNPPFQFVGSTPAHLAVEVPVSSGVVLNFSAPALLSATAVTMVDQDSNVIPFTGLPVTTAAAAVTLTPSSPLPYGKTITATLVAAEITSATAAPLGATTATIPVRFRTEALVAPVVNVTPPTVTSPINADVTLTANVTAGTAPVTLQWYEGTAANFAGATLLTRKTESTLVVQRPTVGVVSYFVRATNPGAQFADSNDAVVTYTDFPVVTSTVPAAAATGVAVDSTITLNFSKAVQLEAGAVSISPVVPFTMVPDFGGPGLATSFVLTPTAPLAVGTDYTVTVDKTKVKDAGNAGMDADKVFSFTTRVPVSITTDPVAQSVLEGQNAVFSVTAVGDGPLSYEWLYEGVAFGAPNLPTLTLNGVLVSLAGSYSVKVTGSGAGNEATSASALLTVTVPSVVITGNGTYEQDFDGLGSGYPLGWKGFKAIGTSAVPVGTVATPTVGDGSGNAGAVLNVGTTAQTDRALGLLASGPYVGAFGVTLTNLTGQPLDGSNVKLAFTMEQWRTSSAAAKERLRFEWKLGGAINGVDGLGALETAGWNPVSAFDLVEKDEGEYPTSGLGTNGAVNGNTSNFQVVLSAASFASLGAWGPGQVLHLRWVDSNDPGNDALLAIDNFSVITEDVPPPPNLVFWDSNGLSAGAGAVPTGTWGTDGFWTADALGEMATTTWTAGADAVFSAGADAVGPFTVTLNGIQDAGSVTVEEGAVVLSGGELLLSRSPALVEVKSAGATVASVISGSEGLRKRGAGTLELQGVNTFSGTLRLGGGVTLIGADTALGNVENDFVFAGGTLATTGALTLPVTRELAGSGTLSPALGTTLTVAGPVAMSLLEVAGAGPVALTNAVVSAGVLSLKSGSELTGQPMTVGTITAVLGGGSAVVGNGLNLGTSARSLSVDAGSQLTLSGDVLLGGVGNTALTKLDAGTLVLTGVNSGLNKLAIGGQGTNLNFGGKVKFNNKDALGATVIFFNYGIMEALVPLTGVNALPVGASMGGRDGEPVVFMGADIELAGASGLFGAGLSGDLVVQVDNKTTFSGAFPSLVNGGGSVDAVRFAGTGIVSFIGVKDTFRAPIKLTDTVTFVMDTVQLGDATSANPAITLAAGTKLVVGADGGTRLVTAYNGLNAETGSSVEFEIGGTTRGASYDAVDFATGAGTADIRVAGTVRVKFLSGYTPAVGHAFRLMKWDNTATRDFAGLAFDLPTLTGGLTWDTGNFASDGVVFISGAGLGPIIIGQPQGGTFANGAQVDLAVSVLGAGPFTYNWRKGGVSLGAPNSSTLSLLNVTTERSGSYSVTVTSGSLSSTSESAEVLVEGAPFITVQPASRAVADGTSVTFGVTAVGVGPFTYAWQFAEAGMVPAQTGSTLQVVAGLATRGNYRVVVTNGFGSTTSAVAVLSLPTAGPATSKPEWDLLADLPAGQIGVPYAFDLNVKADLPGAMPPVFRSATSFSMTGQPTGLVINPTTGEITGTPAAIKSTPYAVSVTARNAFGSAILKTRILINPLPTGALGVFTGPIGRSALLDGIVTGGNGALGGRFDMTVASTGVASGRVTIGTKVYSFSKAKAVIPASPANRLSVAATIKLSTTRNLTVSLLVDTLTGTILNTSTISDGTATVTFTGWRNPWSKLNPATALAGYYTTKIDLVNTALTSAQAPLGAGYLSFTVAPTTGLLTLSGRLSDGSTISMATFAGPAGQMLMFRTLYGTTTRGSLLGALGIAAEANPLNNTVAGPMTWTRPANTASSNRLYRNGFPAPGLLDVTLTGGRYVAPPAKTKANPSAEPRVMGLTDLANQIEVLLTKAGVETALPLQADVKATVALTNKVAFNLDKLVNTRAMSLTFVASKGSFTGKATLRENNPVLAAAVPPLLVAVPRTVTFQGLLVGGVGHGYFILNQLPAVGAVPAQTTSNSPQEAGRVEVKVFVPPVVP
jgi:autotransporter-associated beta strand protein